MLAKLVRLVAALLALLGLLMVLVTWTPLVYWASTKLAGPWNHPSGDVMIVLGSGMLDDRTLDLVSYWRSVYGALYWRTGHFEQVVVSGHGAAPLMKDFLVSHGIPPERIRVEDRSGSTRENAIETARLLSNTPGRKMLVSSDMHMYRAVRAFRKAGLDVLPCPAPHGRREASDWSRRWPAFLELTREGAKIVYYRARGWI